MRDGIQLKARVAVLEIGTLLPVVCSPCICLYDPSFSFKLGKFTRESKFSHNLPLH